MTNTNKDVTMLEEEKLKVEYDKDDGNYNCTYSFTGEDHTLGNLLRYMLMKDPETTFSGYSVPHPSEDIMNVRLQTQKSKTDKVLNRALERISKITDILSEKFSNALNDFDNNMNDE